jgi:general stress protein 26
MTKEGVVDFLTNSKLNLHLSTLDEKGDPNIHPTWFYYDVATNKLYIGTSRQSRKVSNLKKIMIRFTFVYMNQINNTEGYEEKAR